MSPINHIQITGSNEPEDFDDCAAMMASTDPWITLGMNLKDCRTAFEGSYRELYIAKNETGIVGFVILQLQGSFKGYIQTLCVRKDARGMGLGTQILQFCESKIESISPNIFICVSAFNKAALQLYLHVGFEIIGELPNFVKQGFTEILLRKTTGPLLGYQPPK